MTSPALKTKLLKTAIGGLIGLGFGCVLTTGGAGTDECDCIACNSYVGADEDGDGKGDCFCDPGYVWAEPNNDNNFDCDLAPTKPGSPSDCVESYHVQDGDQCYCVSGFEWCNPSDNDDLTCCESSGGSGGPGPGDDGSGDDDGGSDTVDPTAGDETGGVGVCSEDPPPFIGFEPLPEECTAEVEGGFFCTNTQEQGPAGSTLYTCMGGRWVETPEQLDADCEFENAQFAHGCVDTPEGYMPICGDGPGTFCDGEACNECADDDVLNTCEYGNKLEATSCSTFCQEVGIDGITFETGFCDADDQGPFCSCCDSGDEGCPI